MIPFIQFLFFLKKKFQKIVYFSFISILIGYFFISFQNFDSFELALNFGDFLTILCALSFAVNIVLFSYCINPQENEMLNITIVQMIVVGILSFLFQFLFENLPFILKLDYSLVYLIVVCTLKLILHYKIYLKRYVPAHKK